MPGFNTISISKITTIGLFTVAILGPFSVVKLCEKWLKMSNLTFLVRFLPVFYVFFCLMQSIQATKYAYKVSLGCSQYMWSCVEVVSKCQYCNLGCVSYRISFIFFANYILFRLRNTPTKFREAPPSHCKVICCIENRGGGQHGHRR